METPIYGERSKQVKAILVIVIAAVITFVLVGVGFGVGLGIKDKRFGHVLLAIVLLLMTAAAAVLWWWYEHDGIHPKFKWLIFFLIVVVVLTGISVIVVAETTRPPKPIPPIKCYGLYDVDSKVCFSVPSGNLPDCGIPGFCMFFLGGSACCGNCTLGAAKCPAPHPPHSG